MWPLSFGSASSRAWRKLKTPNFLKLHYNGQEHKVRASRAFLWRVVLPLILCALFVWCLLPKPSPSQLQSKFDLKPRHLRLVIPASESNTRLCKTIVSAAILGYPPPTLVNWNQTFDIPKLVSGGSHLAKIGGILSHLDTIDSDDDDDLVLIVDGYDTWFQLRPEVMIARYFGVNRLANARIHEQLGSGTNTRSISQRVIFSAQKRCWPKKSTHPSCWAVPESSLPKNTYGLETDTDIGDEKNPYRKYRQRYLNSGLIMGPVRDLRSIFQRAHWKAERSPGFGSDQAIFADIFGEQELERLIIAHNSRSWARKAQEFVARLLGQYSSVLDSAAIGSHQLLEAKTGESVEFGLGLDYGGQLGFATVFCEYDTEWLSFNDTEHIVNVSKKKGIRVPHIGRLAGDISSSKPPFYSLAGGSFPSGLLPLDRSWNEIPLFTNVWTGSVPVAIHHNAHIDGMKSRIETQWNKTWFQPYARQLLEARVLETTQPIATTFLNGVEHVWWAVENVRSSVMTDDGGDILPFRSVCNNAWADIFADGKSSWNDPS